MTEFEQIHEAINRSLDRVPQAMAERFGAMLKFASRGTRPAIFWCFNSPAEPALLSQKLGPDQPLNATLSLHTMVKGPEAKMLNGRRLVQLYTDQVLATVPEGPILLGGNCQAALVIEAVAHEIIGRSGRVPFLMLLEHQPQYCFPGSVFLMFGSRSTKFNPFLGPVDPIPRLRAQHGSCGWGFLDAKHGEFFREPGILQLCAMIQRAVDEFLKFDRISPGPVAPEAGTR